MRPIEQQFFNDLEKKLWTAADKLRSNLDAAVYKHVVLGLIFLKYVSDAFEERQRELREQFTNPDHDYYMDPAEYGGAGTQEYEDNIAVELEVRDYYTEKNVFWVPVEARWQTLRDCAQLPPKAALPWNKPGKDEPEEMRSVGWLIDNAMEAVQPLLGYRLQRQGVQGPAAGPEIQGHPRPRLRILPRPVRPGRRQEGRPVLHSKEHRHPDRGNAPAI